MDHKAIHLQFSAAYIYASKRCLLAIHALHTAYWQLESVNNVLQRQRLSSKQGLQGQGTGR